MKHRWYRIVGTALLVGTLFATLLISQTTQNAQAPGPYARIAIMRALDGHSVDWEAGYIRHLEWHRQAKDTFAWYSYSVWASTERQRWIIYATFGHTAAELSNPVSPAEDERGQSHQCTAIFAIPGERGLRIPAGAFAWEWCANSDSSGRVHNSGAQLRHGQSVRGGARRRAIKTAGRDALVSTGRGRKYAALRLPASTHEPGGHSRRER